MELDTTLPPTPKAYWQSITPIDSFWACFIPIWFMFFIAKLIGTLPLIPWLLDLLPETPEREYEFPWHWYLFDGVLLPLFATLIITWLVRNVQVGWLILAHVYVAVMLFPHLVSTYSYSFEYSFIGGGFYVLLLLFGYLGFKVSKNGFVVVGIAYFISGLVTLTASALFAYYLPDIYRSLPFGMVLYFKYALFNLIIALVAGAAFHFGRVAISKIIPPATTE